jgi:hypothetical protein
MIEGTDILALCTRFASSLVPLEMSILRQCDNGQTFTSTDAMGREMHISDETVRTMEHGAIGWRAHSLSLEADGIPITPMRRAQSFRQPVASLMGEGCSHTATAAADTADRSELILVASRVGRPRDGTR